MSCRFRFIVCQHPVDAVKLAFLTAAPSSPAVPVANDDTAHDPGDLVLVASSDSGCALSFGCVITEEYAGLAGLLRYSPKDLVIRIHEHGRTFPVVFPNASSNFRRPYGELLDSVRFHLRDAHEITVLLEYERLPRDLPPMYPGDTLTCYWEIRDILSDEHLETFRYLMDRLDNEAPDFRGLHLYTRQQGSVADLHNRAEQIRNLSGLVPPDAPLIEL